MEKVLIGKGQNATCYLVNSRVLKEYNKPSNNKIFNNNILKLSTFSNNTFIFPDEVVFENDNLLKYYMEYIDGEKIYNINKLTKIDNYINAIKIVEYDTSSISIQKIMIRDCGLNNTLYTGDNKIYFVDTDFYITNCNKKDIFSRNLFNVSYSLLYPFLDIYNVFFISQKLNHYLKLVKQGKMLPSYFLSEVKYLIEKQIENKLNNLEDFKDSFNIILKK